MPCEYHLSHHYYSNIVPCQYPHLTHLHKSHSHIPHIPTSTHPHMSHVTPHILTCMSHITPHILTCPTLHHTSSRVPRYTTHPYIPHNHSHNYVSYTPSHILQILTYPTHPHISHVHGGYLTVTTTDSSSDHYREVAASTVANNILVHTSCIGSSHHFWL